MPLATMVRTCLWFDDLALPAAECYCANGGPHFTLDEAVSISRTT